MVATAIGGSPHCGRQLATSGPRIAFVGFQIVLSYGLVNLNKFTINTSLVPSRDAVLGIVAMWLVSKSELL